VHAKRYRRTTDRIEDVAAWVLLAAGMVLIVVSCTVGLGMGGRPDERAQSDADRAPGAAPLVTASPTLSGDGAARSRTAGRTAPTWLSRTDPPASVPMSVPTSVPTSVVKDGLVGPVAATGVVLGLGAVLLTGLWVVVRRATFAYNCAQWEREWRAVAPVWSKGEGRRD
jgi:hypothetical protein